jgi:O-antigen ligase
MDWPTRVLIFTPLLALPFMLNLRIMDLALPNEQPKWAVLLLTALVLVLAMAWRYWRKRTPEPLGLSWPALSLGVFIVLLAIGMVIGPNRVEGAIRFAFWAAAAMVWLVSVWAVRNHSRYPDWLAWSASIAGFTFSLHYWWNYFLDYGSGHYNIAVLFSPIGHVNFTGDVLVVLFPFLIWTLFARGEPAIRIMSWFAVASCGSILLVASSRGALGGLAAGSLLVLAVGIRHGSGLLRGNKMTGWVLVISALLVSFSTYQVLPYHFRELARVSASFTGESGGVARIPQKLTPNVAQPPLAGVWLRMFPLLGDRTPMYASVSAMIADRPWLGHGTGNFPYVYPKYSNAFPDFRDPMSTEISYITNPHNVFLQIASQNGLPAAMIFTGLLAWFLFRLAGSLWRDRDGLSAAGLAAVSAAAFDAMFNHVFFNPASMFVFALLGGMWWGRLIRMPPVVSFHPPRWSAVIPAVLALALTVWPVRWLASDWYAARAIRAEPDLSVMAPNYRLAARLDPYNFRAVYGMAKVGYLRKDYGSVIRELEWLKTIYPFNAAALNLLGVAYMLTGKWPEAEKALFASLQVLPDYDKAQANIRRLQRWATSSAAE